MNERSSLLDILKNLLIQEVPSYANRFFYSLGFLSMTSFLVLILTGTVMVAFGPDWWLTSGVGHFFRSIHLWSTQAFVLFVLLHLCIVLFTSGFRRPRRLTWVAGSLMFFFVLAEAEFGYVLRSDYSSQWRSLQGADLYNGSGIGTFLNNLNFGQIYGFHIILIPLLLLTLLFVHYLLVRVRGISRPARPELPVRMERANHRVLFLRGGVLVAVIVALAFAFPAPFLRPVTIAEVASTDSSLFTQTLMEEFDHSSDTATYRDTIAPYSFDTRNIYVEGPYHKLVRVQNQIDRLDQFQAQAPGIRQQELAAAQSYFEQRKGEFDPANPVEAVIQALVPMGSSGLYEAELRSESASPYNPTYVTRFLSDSGVLESKADKLGITTEQYGMLREEVGSLPPGAWWLAPVGLLDHTLLANDPNQDRDGAEILGLLLLLLIAFPFIPYLNRLPEKLQLWRLLQRK